MEDALFLAAALTILGLGFICWLLFSLAVYALPFFAAVTAGMWAYGTGAGVLGAFAVGLVAGVATFVGGQILFGAIRSTTLRVALAPGLRSTRGDRWLPRGPWPFSDRHPRRGLATSVRHLRSGHRRLHCNGAAGRPLSRSPTPISDASRADLTPPPGYRPIRVSARPARPE